MQRELLSWLSVSSGDLNSASIPTEHLPRPVLSFLKERKSRPVPILLSHVTQTGGLMRPPGSQPSCLNASSRAHNHIFCAAFFLNGPKPWSTDGKTEALLRSFASLAIGGRHQGRWDHRVFWHLLWGRVQTLLVFPPHPSSIVKATMQVRLITANPLITSHLFNRR